MQGLFVVNKYYSDRGMDYVYAALKYAFAARKTELIKVAPHLIYGQNSSTLNLPPADFVLFWDKDLILASQIEKTGIKLFNSAQALAICDDKQKTYAALKGITIPKTISAPIMYDINDVIDHDFLKTVADELAFPLIVKENVGSQGRQVFKADDYGQLLQLYTRLRHTPHHYQKLTGEYGKDLRVYTVGGKTIAACIRRGTDYKSNLFSGGRMELCALNSDYKALAENVSAQLNLDYGAIDFLIADTPIFLEANSNAYFKGIEGLGVDIAVGIAEHVIAKI